MKTLIVDSDHEAAELLANDLRGSGHTVRTSSSEKQCSTVARYFQAEIVLLCDAGIDAKAIRPLFKNVPVITIGKGGNLAKPIDMVSLRRLMLQA